MFFFCFNSKSNILVLGENISKSVEYASLVIYLISGVSLKSITSFLLVIMVFLVNPVP